MVRRPYLIVTCVAVLLILGFAQSLSNIQAVVKTDTNQIQDFLVAYIESGPIYIDDDADFELNGYAGEGTSESPYIIENLNITGTGDAITIINTRNHFRIQNCFFNSTTLWSHSGIYLFNVTDGMVDSSIFFDFEFGVNTTLCERIAVYDCYFESILYGVWYGDSKDCDVTACEFVDCFNCAWQYYSEDILVSRNNMTNSKQYPVYDHISNRTRVLKNSIIGHSNNGVKTFRSTEVYASENTVVGIGGIGFFLWESEDGYIENNIIEDTDGSGIVVDGMNSTVRNNTIRYSGYNGIESAYGLASIVENYVEEPKNNGIHVTYSPNSVVERNTISNAGANGIYTNSKNITISQNKILNSTFVGICVVGNSDCHVLENDIAVTGEYAIWAMQAPKTSIIGNSLNQTGGITCEEESNFCEVGSNTINNTFWTGIRFREASFGIVTNNILTHVVEDGMLFHDYSHNASIIENQVIDAGWQGISVFNSSSCSIERNEIQNIIENGILAWTTSNVHVIYNLIESVGYNGINIDDSVQSQIEKNIISNAFHTGIEILSGTNYAIIKDNEINHTNSYGMNIIDSLGLSIVGNSIDESTINDIRFENSGDANVYLNEFRTPTSQPAEIVDSAGIAWDNETYGNYWEDYDGVDEDGDGIGDTPYSIAIGNIDNYPLMDSSFVEIYVGERVVPIFTMSIASSPSSPTSRDTVDISIQTTYPDWVNSVKLSYSVDSGTTWSNVTASKVNGNWTATIPSLPAETEVLYKIIIEDIKGGYSVSEVFSYTVEESGFSIPLSTELIAGVIILAALVGTVYMVRRGRRKRDYERMFNSNMSFE